MSKFPSRVTYNGSVGRIREIYVVRGAVDTFMARFNGDTIGTYHSYNGAYEAIQEALRAHLQLIRSGKE